MAQLRDEKERRIYRTNTIRDRPTWKQGERKAKRKNHGRCEERHDRETGISKEDTVERQIFRLLTHCGNSKWEKQKGEEEGSTTNYVFL